MYNTGSCKEKPLKLILAVSVFKVRRISPLFTEQLTRNIEKDKIMAVALEQKQRKTEGEK